MSDWTTCHVTTPVAKKVGCLGQPHQITQSEREGQFPNKKPQADTEITHVHYRGITQENDPDMWKRARKEIKWKKKKEEEIKHVW